MAEAHHGFGLLMLYSSFVHLASIVVFVFFFFVSALRFFTFGFRCFGVALSAHNAAGVFLLLLVCLEVLAFQTRLPAKFISLQCLYTYAHDWLAGIYPAIESLSFVFPACGICCCLYDEALCSAFTYYCNFHALNNVTVACTVYVAHTAACRCMSLHVCTFQKRCASGRIRNQQHGSHFNAFEKRSKWKQHIHHSLFLLYAPAVGYCLSTVGAAATKKSVFRSCHSYCSILHLAHLCLMPWKLVIHSVAEIPTCIPACT